ncbi:hypothetical protein GPECTOR_342g83 [Gonium pectorale]|uniref:DSBA-like thioredoxin domain-containing protein n=1 Tax=Gonium pectorale TaxID=33097 RepID=A0A150FVL7_GONPE|nr:hypothetical protein GPECTOR_342g83 [Gonium pectorale]|eukprot:KXZ41652.1 hypothetical protein GPECTOR_342g83 [Gonium pectorale]
MASDLGLAERANDLLFARTYEQGGNVSLVDELLDVAEALGMQRGAVRRELLRGDGGALRASVLERDAAAKQRWAGLGRVVGLRIQAVPHFIIAAGPASRTKYALNGAHQTSDLLGAMERVAAEESLAGAIAASRPAGAALPYGGLMAHASPLTASHALATC